MDVVKRKRKKTDAQLEREKMRGLDQSGRVTEPVKDDEEEGDLPEEGDESILEEARERFKMAHQADEDDRQRAKDELRFAWNIDEAQWDDESKKLRKGRPMITENRFPAFIRQVINAIRQSRPAGKVLPVDGQGDKYTASVIEGNIRNIEANSRADMAYDNAAMFAAYCGRGYWKITTEYVEDTFDQDLVIQGKRDPFSVWDDPNCQLPDKSDRRFAFEGEWVDNDEFEREHGEPPTTFTEAEEVLGDSVGLWFEEKKTLVVNYWRVKCEREKIYLMSDGVVVRDTDEYLKDWFERTALEREVAIELAIANGNPAPDIPLPPPPTVEREREQEKKSVEWFLLTGTKVYKKGKWAGRYIPLVYCGGEEISVENKTHTKGLTQDAQGLAKSNNYTLSAQMEKIALSPKIPYIGAKGSFKTDQDKWATSNTHSYPYIEYDPVPNAPPPQRNDSITVNPELATVKSGVLDGMRSVVGLMGASLGDNGPEIAGVAIAARKVQGDTAVFHFMDNLVRAVRYSCMVLIDAMPHYYDSKRMIRIINPDNEPMMVAIKQAFTPPGAKGPVLINFSKGKYDVTVTAGPAFETQRQQTAAVLTDLSNKNPQLFGSSGDIIVKSLAVPQAEEMAARLRRTIPPHILGEGPSPQEQQLQQQIQQMQQQLEQSNTTLLGLQSELAKQQASLQTKSVEHETATRKLEAQIATAQADAEKARLEVKKKEAELAITVAKQATAGVEESQKIAADRLILEVERMLAKHSDTVEQMCKQVAAPGAEPPEPGEDLEHAARQEQTNQVFAAIAQTQQQLHDAIAALTEATLRPRESRVVTPDGREFRSLSTAVQQEPNITP